MTLFSMTKNNIVSLFIVTAAEVNFYHICHHVTAEDPTPTFTPAAYPCWV